MYGDDGPDDDYMTSEQACDAGWLMPDDVDELRDLLKHVEWPEDAHSRGTAALILIEGILNPAAVMTVGSDEHARASWAKVKLNRHILA